VTTPPKFLSTHADGQDFQGGAGSRLKGFHGFRGHHGIHAVAADLGDVPGLVTVR
jgi:hypothetical protein